MSAQEFVLGTYIPAKPDREGFKRALSSLVSDIIADGKRGDGVIPKTRLIAEQKNILRLARAADVHLNEEEVNAILGLD